MATHYCGGHAVKKRMMVGTNALDCGMGNMETPCEGKSNESQLTKKPCCENQYLTLSVDDDYNISQFHINTQLQFAVAFVHTYLATHFSESKKEPQFTEHSPPLPGRDILVMNQVFRI